MTTATTSYGTLRGIADRDVLSFRGIPFAKPPVGSFRFRSPEPPEPWTGVRDASQFGPGSLQAKPIGPDLLGMELPAVSEDCLTLNVWTPSLEGRRPVMVWIHGGAFIIGSGSQPMYNGAQLAGRGDVVVVTINYRLGVFGFLHGATLCGDALDSTGNEAILDDIAALRWVKDEIAAFGGDPENVTIFGESAGSISIAAILAAPAATGLYHKAIMQSGSANLIAAPDAASKATAAILQGAGLTPGEAGKLRDLSAEDLANLQQTATPRGGGATYAPVLEPSVVPRSTFDLAGEGALSNIPLMIGTTADEMRLFMLADIPGMNLDEAGLLARCETVAPGRASELAQVYRDGRAARAESTTPSDTWWAIQTDVVFRVPAINMASLASRHGAVYSYLLTQQSPAMDGLLGACHALDLPFVFGLDNDPRLLNLSGSGPERQQLSLAMQDAWLAFARTGNPAAESLPAWPRYDEAGRATMILNAAGCGIEHAPRETERAFWG